MLWRGPCDKKLKPPAINAVSELEGGCSSQASDDWSPGYTLSATSQETPLLEPPCQATPGFLTP